MTPRGHHRRHHRHRGGPHSRHRRGPPWARRGFGRGSGAWPLARGLRRRILFFLMAATLLGLMGGWLLSATHHQPHSDPRHMLGVMLVLGTLLWTLSWAATWRIAQPLWRLADIASEVRDGKLSERENIQETDDEVGDVAGAVRGLADRVARQLDDQRALLGAVSHELRSPLGRLRILVELSREGTGPDDLHDQLQTEIDGMDELIADLLASSRIDFAALSPTELVAYDVAVRALEIAGVDAGCLEMDADDLRVVADPTLLARALAGLLDNAERYGDGVFKLIVEADGSVLRFVVEDAGQGFSEAELEQMWQPFWRRPHQQGQPARPPGTGLGLALVRQIAEAHDGVARAENREGGGARVWIELPR